MDRVGGYDAYQRLVEDERAYEDVVIVLLAEAEALKLREAEEKAKSGSR